MQRRSAAACLFVIGIALASCVPARQPGSLAPTLEMREVNGRSVATQNGIPVPTHDWQARPRIELDGSWRIERMDLDVDLTMTDRVASLPAIEDEAGGRHLPDHDDAGWGSVAVPGTMNAPPDGTEGGAWYRRSFEVPREWAGRTVTLRFGSANYVADAWLNGRWLGYHEGGSTPFAFDVSPAVLLGADNVLAVRVHTIPLGTRADILPWGLIDWWNYGGLTGSVWLEAAPAVHVVRADVVPHLDAVDVALTLHHGSVLAGSRGGPMSVDRDRSPITVTASILPASVSDDNLLDPDPRSLVPDGAQPLVTVSEELTAPLPGDVDGAAISVSFGDADLWSPAHPALYVLRLDVRWTDQPRDAREARPPDTYWTTFGIRQVAVDPLGPRILLNGEAAFFRGVGLHAESLTFDAGGTLLGGSPAQPADEVLAELRDAAAVGANQVRTGHQPGDPTMLMLADRLGFAVWEEIPIYHATPFVFDRIMSRGIPQQMLREMALRDMNRPSVLFHGLANESTGAEERAAALTELHEVDRAIDGTRLTGQAVYGWDPADTTHAPLDVAGITSYQGVFYGDDPGADTRRALREVNATNPDKPVMILEFGRWADQPADEARQLVIFEETYAAIERVRSDRPGGFVSGATWWTLHDFATQIAGVGIEDFGLYRPDRSPRPAGQAAASAFNADAGAGSELALEPELVRPRAEVATGIGDWTLALYLGYAFAFVIALLGAAVFVVTRRGGRAVGRAR
ncbi:MAG: sugar-binding domain-containing protein [Candidatus Limnocylindria bacterium]